MKLTIIDDIKINTEANPLNYDGHEDQLSVLIDDLENVYRQVDHDLYLQRAISLRDNGVFFPSVFMMVTGRGRPTYRPPSAIAMNKIPGYADLRDNIYRVWPKIEKDKTCHVALVRFVMSIYLSTDVKNILDLTPDALAEITRTYKDNRGFWNKTIINHCSISVTLTKIAEALGRINGNQTYKLATKQPRILKTNEHGELIVKTDVRITKPTSDIVQWVAFYNEWMETVIASNTRPHLSAFGFLLEWLENYSEDVRTDPLRFLIKTKRSPTFVEFMKFGKLKPTQDHAQKVSIMVKFTDWVRNEYLCDTDPDGSVVLGEPLILPNDFEIIGGAWINSTASNTAKSKPLPSPWRLKLRDILRRDDYAVAKALDDQWTDWENPETGKHERVWVPTLAYAFDVMLEIPLRLMQIMCLDSGEGDDKRYRPTAGWAENDGPSVGWWKNDPNAKVKHRGVLKELGTPIKSLVGFNINTNKTSGNDERYGEIAGYEIPWQNDYVINLMANLREWQEIYNQVNAPLPIKGIAESTFGYKPSPLLIKKTPDRFYLFRSPNSVGTPEAPPSYRQRYDFWVYLMDILEKELRAEGEIISDIIIVRKPDGSPQKAAYHIHGLRVALITAFAEAGVPIEILSKIIVGHSTILMTLFYCNYNEAAISSLLTEKALRIEEQAEEKMKQQLVQKCYEQAQRVAVYNDENSFRRTFDDDVEPYWLNIGYGFCPNGGSRCHEGGEPIEGTRRKKDAEPKYAPVSGGSKNCVRCRFFVSGIPFALRMWLKVNKALEETKKVAAILDNRDAELGAMRDKRRSLIKAQKWEEHRSSISIQIRELEAMVDMNTEKLNEKILDLHAAWRIMKKIDDKVRNGEADDMSLLTQGGLEFTPNFREGTRFELTTMLNNAAEQVPFLRDEDLEREQQMFLDTLLIRSNLEPLSIKPLSDAAKRRAANAGSLWLLENIGASEVEMLHRGEATLQQLGCGEGEGLCAAMNPELLTYSDEGTPKAIESGAANG